jgi:hypothetical protein
VGGAAEGDGRLGCSPKHNIGHIETDAWIQASVLIVCGSTSRQKEMLDQTYQTVVTVETWIFRSRLIRGTLVFEYRDRAGGEVSFDPAKLVQLEQEAGVNGVQSDQCVGGWSIGCG